MAEAETAYRRLDSYDDEESPNHEREVLVHVPEGSKARWNHIENLDYFFTRIYHFHQKHGFACMMLAEFFELVQFLFVVTFTTFLINCVDYDILFANKQVHPQPSRKVTLYDALLSSEKCTERIRGNSWIIFLIVMAGTFWLYRLIKVIYNFSSYLEIRAFYINALKIPMAELQNFSWQEVQERVLAVQKEQQMCIHKRELTELDMHHRILRFKNYLVAMVNKSLLPVRVRVPFAGESALLTQGLKYNLEMLLFWGPGAPFQSAWSLRPEYKRAGCRLELAERLGRTILLVGLANLVLCPLVVVWQVLHAFFRYAEVLKREPGSLGARRWSLYGQLYLRHLNELDHELRARLGRGYRHAARYMDSFTAPMMAVLAKNVTFFAGSLLAVLLALTVYDEDVLSVEHVLTAITALGVLLTVCRAFIPDEHLVWNPEHLLQAVLAHIHYMPEHWKGIAHKTETRDEFSQLFQYKAAFIMEELLSPIITPFILIFGVRPKALEIVDFFRNFTVEVVGVGDVCSFAQMDIRRHGNPTWMSAGQTEASYYQQAEDGKTELSLVHFAISNPRWRPPRGSNVYLNQLREQVQRDSTANPQPLLFSSLQTIESQSGPYGLLGSMLGGPSSLTAYRSTRDATCSLPEMSAATAAATALMSLSMPSASLTPGPREELAEMPDATPGNTTVTARPGTSTGAVGGMSMSTGGRGKVSFGGTDFRSSSVGSSFREGPSQSSILSEFASAEMSLHAIYMHEARRNYGTSDAQARYHWQQSENNGDEDTMDEVNALSGFRESSLQLHNTGSNSGSHSSSVLGSGQRETYVSPSASIGHSGDYMPSNIGSLQDTHGDSLGLMVTRENTELGAFPFRHYGGTSASENMLQPERGSPRFGLMPMGGWQEDMAGLGTIDPHGGVPSCMSPNPQQVNEN
ncbi:autophagy-related protein 9A-like isoform X1 [Lethenteron reissneri]|uniref:autophagy-related protein 9A-like isoform X1 n=1 Tax=Lethenteron reissneri TaxID=7753 RepID=UPI002AB7B78E|nr:autophagy-related protein 9A-like isoform X1 [Lethenteron reissneri]XP_061413227.1 autophagy-related protein 9A-like isoform X1 [Lethenteron reissneri]XP_061413228.1 autophagy-related protein 9A-like isoform X1 [Lethenteron reissneri]